MVLGLILMIGLTETVVRHSGQYLQCSRGDCLMLGDSEVDWQFDQPERIKMTPVLREHLGEGERLNISFTSVDCLTRSQKDEKYEAKVPRKIHMIWIGSPLPEKLWKGPASFSFLNPGFTLHVWLDNPPVL